MPVLAVTKERRAGETRVAVTPDAVKKLIALGLDGRSSRPAPGAPPPCPTPTTRPPARRSSPTAAEAAVRRRHPAQGARAGRRGDRGAEARRDRRRPAQSVPGPRGAGRRWPRQGVTRLRHGVRAAHHPRPGDGRALQPGQPRRLPRGDRGGRGLWPGPADDDDRRRHGRRRPRCSSWAPASPACRPSPPRAAWARSSPPPTCARPPRSRSRAWAPSSSRSRTRSSRPPRPPPATPRR